MQTPATSLTGFPISAWSQPQVCLQIPFRAICYWLWKPEPMETSICY